MSLSKPAKIGLITGASLVAAYSLFKLFSKKSDIIHSDKNHDVLSNLSKKDAFNRSQQVSDVDYSLVISFLPGGEFYEGYVLIKFNLRSKGDLFIDYAGDFIHSYTINGNVVSISEKIFNSRRIFVPTKFQSTDSTNIVQIRFRAAYHKDGEGLHHYLDPEDNQQYMYTQFEAFNAHKCFPCFDQPDLKA